MKNNKGITLVATIIAVMLLLILAGVSIGAITGNKGTIKEATDTVEKAERESIIQKIEADLYNLKIKTGKMPTVSELTEIINDNYGTVSGDSFVSKQGNYKIGLSEILGWK